MKLVDIDSRTNDTFFRCLHDEIPEDPVVGKMRRQWCDDHKAKGLRMKVLLRDDDAVVGLCQYMPIEHSFLIGKDLMQTELHQVMAEYPNGKILMSCIDQDAVLAVVADPSANLGYVRLQVNKKANDLKSLL